MSPTPKPIEIFRAGTHTSAEGKKLTFTESDLRAIARGYDAGRHEAPIVIGHPTDTAPAMGWVGGLQVFGDRLVAVPQQVEPTFAELVRQGRYKKVSSSFYPPDHPGNPTPGHWQLRHVGFLGAMPPSVKGLKEASFADAEGTVTFADWSDQIVVKLFRGLRDWLISKTDLQTADTVLPSYMLDNLQTLADADTDESTSAQDAALAASYSDPQRRGNPSMTTTEVAAAAALEQRTRDIEAREATLKQRETALGQQEATFSERATAIRRADSLTFVEGLVNQGKLLPAHKAPLATFLAGLDASTAVSFAEGEGAAAETPDAFFRRFLAELPKRVPLDEIAAGTGGTIDFSDPHEIDRAAAKYQAEQATLGNIVGAAAAVAHVTRGNRA